jgi:hypothetical protein|tara:strand:+ start:749 stop:1660 length:912 start_codon:yes stop_codon:yes gene_type:complete
MNENAIITLADSNYFDMLEELVDSIRNHPESENISICVLDAGLTDEQIRNIEKKVYKIKKANWDIEVPNYKVGGKEWLKSQVSRAFLPNYFPEFKKYLWIDCDAWVQDWSCIELFFKACNNGKLGITQTMGPGYRIMSKVNWLLGSLALIKSQNYKHARSSGIKEEDARKIAFAPHLNIGVFSLEKNSICWSIWQDNLKKTLSKGKIFGSEGLAINLSVYVNNVPVEFLPLNCNWIASNLLPKYNEDKKIFVEPNLPNYTIGIMHLAAGIWVDKVDMRVNKNLKTQIETLSDKKVLKSLRYQG